MVYENGHWVGIITGNRVSINDIEYVTVLHKQDGGRISLPLSDNPFENPLNIQVLSFKKSQNQQVKSSNSKTYNCTEGGMYLDGFKHCKLIDFINSETKEISNTPISV